MGILRLLLALSVVASHGLIFLNLSFVGGPLAVQAFFIVSGFYISLILNEKYIGVNENYFLFITNRILRLYPIYWTVLILIVISNICIFILSKGTQFHTFEIFREIHYSLTAWIYIVFSNVFILFQDFVCFIGVNPATGNVFFTQNFMLHFSTTKFFSIRQAWTISLELYFYLLAPFILRKNFKFILILALLSFLLRVYLYNFLNLNFDPWTHRFFPTEFFYFLLGFFSYKGYKKICQQTTNKIFEYVIFISLFCFTVFKSILPEIKLNYFPVPIFDFMYLLLVAFTIPFLFKKFKNNKLDTKIGDLSYPVYISHIFIYYVLEYIKIPIFQNKLFRLMFLILFSYTLNYFVANPIEKFRQARVKN
jgi:peptidoglycan/LPS O-acetylase OafA/YrhL